MKKSLKTNNDIKIEIPTYVSGLLHKYHNRFLADDSLSDKEVLLLSLYLIEYTSGKEGGNYDKCRGLFSSLGRNQDNFRKVLYAAKQESLIEAKNKVIYFLIRGLKNIEKIMGQTGKMPVHIIRSGESFTAIKSFEEFLLNEIKGREILLCDSYISPSTLFPFSVLRKNVKTLKILTSKIYDTDKFQVYKDKLQNEKGISIEVRKSKKIHDRYLLCDGKCWFIGGSIKDLGSKDTIIKEISEVDDSLRELFHERWNKAT